jgi:hypothetical protein
MGKEESGMTINLDELDRLARAAATAYERFKGRARIIGDMAILGKYTDAANPAAVLELIGRLRLIESDLFHAQQALFTEGIARGSFERMFNAACSELGLINEHLQLDPNDGGCDPIISAIEEIEADRDRLAAQNIELEGALLKIKNITGYAGFNIGGPMAVLGGNITDGHRTEYLGMACEYLQEISAIAEAATALASAEQKGGSQ